MDNNIYISTGKSQTASTLLIPEELVQFYRLKEKEFKGSLNLFHFVVNTGHRVYRKKRQPGKMKISYQPVGLNLQKIDFFPNNNDWEKFRMLSYSLRVSMTLLFVMILLEWDKFEIKSAIVPKIPDKIRLILSLTISSTITHLKLQRLNL